MDNVNPLYCIPVSRRDIQRAYEKSSPHCVAIAQFLTQKAFLNVKQKATHGWRSVNIPDQHKYEEHATLPVNKTIATFVNSITGKSPLIEGNRRFHRGDYTILHDKKTQKAGVIALLFLDDWKTEWGGEFVLVKNGQTLLRFTPRANTLLVVQCEKETKRFVKYINHNAKGKLTILG